MSAFNYSFTALNKEKKFYDLEDHYDKIIYKPRDKAKNEFGLETEHIIPSEGEIRYLGIKHTDCRYHSLGLELCKKQIVRSDRESFLGCKKVIDSMYRCYTQDQYGDEYHKLPEEALPYAKKFLDCYFLKKNYLTDCMFHFENSIRAIYRDPETKLQDY